MPSNSRQLVTRVSQKTADAFHAQREEMGLSMNQYLKLLVILAQGRGGPMESALEDARANNEQERQVLKNWLRGK